MASEGFRDGTLLNIRRKINLTSGPAKKICQKNAIGKFITVVWSHTEMTWLPLSLKRSVAARLMSGHIHATDTAEIARIRWNGFSFAGSTRRKAVLFAIMPTRKKSRKIKVL